MTRRRAVKNKKALLIRWKCSCLRRKITNTASRSAISFFQNIYFVFSSKLFFSYLKFIFFVTQVNALDNYEACCEHEQLGDPIKKKVSVQCRAVFSPQDVCKLICIVCVYAVHKNEEEQNHEHSY